MKNMAKTLITALAVSAAPFAAPQAQAGSPREGVADYACIKNVGGGALSKMRVIYSYNVKEDGKYKRGKKHSPWSRAIAVGQTVCVGLGFIPSGGLFHIQTKSVALGDPSAFCTRGNVRILRRQRLPEDRWPANYRPPKKHVSYNVKTSILRADCVGGPYHWNNCKGCKYHAWADREWTSEERRRYAEVWTRAKDTAIYLVRKFCGREGYPPCAYFPDHPDYQDPELHAEARKWWEKEERKRRRR